jgi:hypothetical protein
VIFLTLKILSAQILMGFLSIVREYSLNVFHHLLFLTNIEAGKKACSPAWNVPEMFGIIKLYNKNFSQADGRCYLLTGVQLPVMITICSGDNPDSGTTLRSKKFGFSLQTNCLNEQKSNCYSRVWQTNKDRVN